jgi:hypothetical protein
VIGTLLLHLFLPLLFLRFVFKVVVALIVLPFALVALLLGVGVAVVAMLCVVLVPLLPLAFIVVGVWAVVRLLSRPAVV